jgi:hypothetical protein
MSESSGNAMAAVRVVVVALLVGAMAYIAWYFLIAGGDPRPADVPAPPAPATPVNPA